MNTLATFSSPLDSLHFAHPAATSAILDEASLRCGGKLFGGSGAAFSPAPAASSSANSSFKARFSLKKRSSAVSTSPSSSSVEKSASAASRPRRLEISSPVLLSSSNPIAHTLCTVAADASQELDVPHSPTLSFASRDSRDFVLAPPPYTPIAAKERSLVDAQEVERRLSEYDDEYSQGSRTETAARDGRIANDLRRMGL